MTCDMWQVMTIAVQFDLQRDAATRSVAGAGDGHIPLFTAAAARDSDDDNDDDDDDDDDDDGDASTPSSRACAMS